VLLPNELIQGPRPHPIGQRAQGIADTSRRGC